MLKLIEECAGTGDLSGGGNAVRQVQYRIARYHMHAGNGLPIPGMHRIEGQIDGAGTLKDLVGIPLTLRLEDGRALGIMLADADGKVFAEGHGPSRCLCCS